MKKLINDPQDVVAEALLGIEAARTEDREVDDAVARAIAAQLHGGQSTALYTFVSTGSLEHDRLESELRELYRDPNKDVTNFVGRTRLLIERSG